jgi:hypothetical protein
MVKMRHYRSGEYTLKELGGHMNRYQALVYVSSPTTPGSLNTVEFTVSIKDHKNPTGEIKKELNSRNIQVGSLEKKS